MKEVLEKIRKKIVRKLFRQEIMDIYDELARLSNNSIDISVLYDELDERIGALEEEIKINSRVLYYIEEQIKNVDRLKMIGL